MLTSRSMQWSVSIVDFKPSQLLWNRRSTPSLLHLSTIVKKWAILHLRDIRTYIQSGICTPWKVMGIPWTNLIDPFEQEGSVTSKRSTEQASTMSNSRGLNSKSGQSMLRAGIEDMPIGAFRFHTRTRGHLCNQLWQRSISSVIEFGTGATEPFSFSVNSSMQISVV